MREKEKEWSLFGKIKLFKPSLNAIVTAKKTKKRTQGDKAENLACRYLQKQGLTILDSNFTTRAGEVDLIMYDKNNADTLIFVEVRYRKNQNFGGAAASVTPKKQQRIIKAALAYQQQNAPQSSMRFDVVAIEGDNDVNGIASRTVSQNTHVNWIKSAFDGF